MPRIANPFALDGQWLRGTLHAHTTNSDGAMPPDRLIAHYAHAGWDFLALTDHWKTTELPEPNPFPGLVVIRGTEVSTDGGSTELGTSYHIVGLNLEGPIEQRKGLTGVAAAQWYIDAIREQGGEAHLAHPYWSGLTFRDVDGIRGLLALEVFNADTEVHIGRGRSEQLWDELLSRRIPTLGIAVDDCHRPGQDSLRGWTVVRARDRSVESIMAALRAGHFYASSGPEIHDVQLEIDPAPNGGFAGRVLVRCSPARSITLVADATRGARLNAGPFGMASRARRLRTASGHGPEGTVEGELLTGGEFLLTGTERYVRVQVEDDRGRCAWTNPLFVRTSPDEPI